LAVFIFLDFFVIAKKFFPGSLTFWLFPGLMSKTMVLIRKKNRKNSLRRPTFDYSSQGAYFITIITKNRRLYLGSIQHQKIALSNAGVIVWECWQAIPIHYPKIKLGTFVVMPDHVHGIINIFRDQCFRGEACLAPENHSPSLGVVIGSFKSAATKKIHESGNPEFGWHRRYHDHIIRDNLELTLIDQYIRDNPRRWQDPSR